MRGVAWFLLVLSDAVLLVSCFPLGPPMHGNCRYMPTIKECQGAANRYITDDCLRKCIRRLCVVGKAKCGEDEDEPLRCATRKKEGDDVGGYVPPWKVGDPPRWCEQPREEFSWCEIPKSPPCQEKNMVHELAHACGWHHGDGQGVPGNDGHEKCR
jgi:hypothetical protein